MERIPKGSYTPEFRVEAVKLVEMERLSVDAAAKRLSVPKSSLGNKGTPFAQGETGRSWTG
jgi:transposase